MLDKKTFVNILNSIETFVGGYDKLEQALNTTFDNNFITNHVDKLLTAVGESFFTTEELTNIDYEVTIQTVLDIIYHFAFAGDFGLKTDVLRRLYVENEGLETEKVYDATDESKLYDLIIAYIQPKTICTTYTLYC